MSNSLVLILHTAIQDVTIEGIWVKGTWDSLYSFCNFLCIYISKSVGYFFNTNDSKLTFLLILE